jgi:hypothetical protein
MPGARSTGTFSCQHRAQKQRQQQAGAHQANGGAHPGAVVVKAFNAVVVDAAVVSTWWLVEVARVIVPHSHLVAIGENDLLGSAGRSSVLAWWRAASPWWLRKLGASTLKLIGLLDDPCRP